MKNQPKETEMTHILYTCRVFTEEYHDGTDLIISEVEPELQIKR